MSADKQKPVAPVRPVSLTIYERGLMVARWSPCWSDSRKAAKS